MLYIRLLALFAFVAFTAARADWDVSELGATGDGETDDTAVFQRALDEAAAAGGGIVQAPAGRYRISSSITIPRAVTLQGVFRTPPTDRGGSPLRLDGTVLLAYANRGNASGDPFIRLGGDMATLAGVIIHYPEWSRDDVPPVPYPPAIAADGVNDVSVLDTLIVNAYEGIHFERTARFIVRNVFGYPSYRGLYVDACYDIGRVENCHFWPFGVVYNPKDPYCLWVNTEGVAFEFARTDWQYVLNTFCFGYGVGYKFSETKNGSCNGNFLGIGADSCRRAVLVEECQAPGLLITNGEFVGRWESEDSVCIEIAESGSDGKVSLANCSFWGPVDRCVWLRTPKTQFTATATHFRDFDNHGRGAPAIQLDTGKAIIQGNTFGEHGTHVLVGADVQSAIIMGNQANGGLIVENGAGDRAQMVANENSPVEWDEKALSHYRVRIGEPGDNPYVRGWYKPEKGGAWPEPGARMRWSRAESALKLPVTPGRRYAITLAINAPQHAIMPEAGLFLGETRIASLPQRAGLATISGEFTAGEGEWETLVLRVNGWVPAQVETGSDDKRTLGIALHEVTMRQTGAADEVFDANRGGWLAGPK